MRDRKDYFVIGGVFFALLVMALIGFLTTSTVRLRTEKLTAEIELMKSERLIYDLTNENERLHYIRDLSVEFNLSPMVVLLVDHFSSEICCDDYEAFRLIQTPEFLTFIALSVIHAESGGNVNAIGDSGKALGLTQLHLPTARDYEDVSRDQLFIPETNIRIFFSHFVSLLKHYRGNVALALYSWNRGRSRVDNLISYGLDPSNEFGFKVYEASIKANGGRNFD